MENDNRLSSRVAFNFRNEFFHHLPIAGISFDWKKSISPCPCFVQVTSNACMSTIPNYPVENQRDAQIRTTRDKKRKKEKHTERKKQRKTYRKIQTERYIEREREKERETERERERDMETRMETRTIFCVFPRALLTPEHSTPQRTLHNSCPTASRLPSHELPKTSPAKQAFVLFRCFIRVCAFFSASSSFR